MTRKEEVLRGRAFFEIDERKEILLRHSKDLWRD